MVFSLVVFGVLVYDHLVLAQLSGSGTRLLPSFFLQVLCKCTVKVAANMSLLDGRREDLLAAAARNRRVEQRFRRRDGTTAILFLHFHKAGGSSFCAAADANHERTAVNAGSHVLVQDPSLNCNICYQHEYAVFHQLGASFGRKDCPFEDVSVTGSAVEQRDGFDRLVVDGRGPRLSFIAVETPVRSVSPSFLSGPDRPWVYATAVRHPYDALLSEYRMKCPVKARRSADSKQKFLRTLDMCEAAGDSVFAYARIKAALPGGNHLPGGLIDGLTGIPREMLKAEILDSSSEFCWNRANGYTIGPCGAERLVLALHQPHNYTVESVSTMPRTARVRLIVAEAKWRLEQFSVVAIVDGGFGTGLQVAGSKLGWQEVNECAVRRGTHSGAAMRDITEFRENADFRTWLHLEFEHDIEVYEYAKALAQWQFEAIATEISVEEHG